MTIRACMDLRTHLASSSAFLMREPLGWRTLVAPPPPRPAAPDAAPWAPPAACSLHCTTPWVVAYILAGCRVLTASQWQQSTIWRLH